MPVVEFTTTRMFNETLQAWLDGKRYCLHEGGTSSSKTWSTLQGLVVIGQAAKEPMLISVVSESLPHLKRGCIRDFFNIIGEQPESCERWSRTDFIYHFPKADMEFFGADDQGKVRGPRRQILFINEANNVPWETARSLDIRTEKFTICDWNPVGEFWAHENWKTDPRAHYCHSTYLDAKHVIPKDVVENIEAQRDKDPNWWNIYGLGLIGKVEGLVYPLFNQVDRLPEGEVGYGLDFGFSGDPAVLVRNVVVGGDLYSQELFYETGLTNDDIARRMDLLRIGHGEPIYCDSAEPKSIEELRQKGFNVQPTQKGPGSVEFGHQKVNQFYQFWTKDSVNCIKEQRNFRYVKDRMTDRLTDKTTHQWSHGMDARRYYVAAHRLSKMPGTRIIRLKDRR